ncbi:hypothetical protein BVC80_1833g24 [Macleaya cordata]|uniref:Uncharacterized protein n=1 Tax=Macleaya cordata TaxID=56857 RepID=A0A200R6N3_MACCD|nr:hypothetical protein BVC80_1833g24 [Macleaya cordata]
MRILNAIQRERLLEMHLLDMQIELENLAWDKKKLEERLHVAIQDLRIMESILEEIEDEHDKAISRIELLENELQDLKEENLRLNEIHGKGIWNFKGHDDTRSGGKVCDDDKYGIPLVTEYDVSSWNSGYEGSGVMIQDLLMHKNAWENDNKSKVGTKDFLKIGSKGEGPLFSFPSNTRSPMVADDVIDQRRGVALSQSLFSAILSLLVGMIIWKAEDPCMPLVVALFSVVGMSLKSVVQFFSLVENKPASDAVALLSFNWFILGTLTYPTLPKVAHLLSPMVLKLANRTVCWLGLSSS